MNIVIFAGGVGTRLWPLSRKKSPKQFEQIVGNKSTVQLAVDRLLPSFSPKNIYLSTNQQYVALVQKQLAFIPKENIIGEPEMRDVGPAVGLLTAILSKKSLHTPMAILWSDHLVKEKKLFTEVLQAAEHVISDNPNKIVFIAQKPRFASQNLGWIAYGNQKHKQNSFSFCEVTGFKYRPDPETATAYYKSGKYAWNLGYFVTTPSFLMNKYKKLVPDMYKKLVDLQKAWGTKSWEKTLNKIYPTLEKISFDNAILEKLDKGEAYVVSVDLKWSDVGAWEALKEALQESQNGNVTKGNVLTEDSNDCLVYNYNDKQLLVTIDTEGMLIVNTDDVTLVCKKESVPKIKKLVKSFSATKYEHLT